MPKNILALKPRELIRLLEQGGCSFLRDDEIGLSEKLEVDLLG
jgi:hypothetical protein